MDQLSCSAAMPTAFQLGSTATQCRQPPHVHSFAERRKPPRAAAAHVATAPAQAPLQKQQQAAERLRFGFPKGSLQNSTHELFRKAGAGLRASRSVLFYLHARAERATAPRPCCRLQGGIQ